MFRPPFDEFEIQRVDVPAGESVAPLPNPGPLLLLVQAGAGSAVAAGGGPADGAEQLRAAMELRRGSVVFVPAGTAVTYSASGAGTMTVWAAAVNAKVFAPAAAPAAAEEAAAVEKELVAA